MVAFGFIVAIIIVTSVFYINEAVNNGNFGEAATIAGIAGISFISFLLAMAFGVGV